MPDTPTYKPGSIVRVLPPDEMTDRPEEEGIEGIERIVANHGYLYIVEAFVPKNTGRTSYKCDSYACRSVATGKEKDLFLWEITGED